MTKMTNMFTKVFMVAAVVVTAIALPGVASAQKEDPMAPHWLEVTKVTVRPEKVGEFRNFVKNEFSPALVKGGVKLQYAWSTRIFGEAFTYYFVTPIEKFVDFDGPSPIEKALGKDAVGPFFSRAGALISGVHTYAMRERPDLSYTGKMSGPPKMAVLIGINVGQGHEADFESFMTNEYLPAFRKSDALAFLAHQTAFGGSQSEYTMLGIIDSFADLDKGHPIARVLGQDGFKKLMQKLPAGTITESEVDIIRFEPSLSIVPAAK